MYSQGKQIIFEPSDISERAIKSLFSLHASQENKISKTCNNANNFQRSSFNVFHAPEILLVKVDSCLPKILKLSYIYSITYTSKNYLVF